tara:strand:- start:949 stop:1128 length:180 start_codon:yes stop_codon:yes gene_type:complete
MKNSIFFDADRGETDASIFLGFLPLATTMLLERVLINFDTEYVSVEIMLFAVLGILKNA